MPFFNPNKNCRQTQPGELPRLTRSKLESKQKERNNEGFLELGAVDLSMQDLTQVDLHKVVLYEWGPDRNTMIGACIESSILDGANLDSSILNCVNFRNAQLDFIKMRKSLLSAANFEHASLGAADLEKSNFGSANLQEAMLWKANMNYCDFSFTNLSGADLSSASLKWSNLQYADLSNIDLSRIETGGLQGVKLYRAKLNNTILRKEDLGKKVGEELEGDYLRAREVYLTLKQHFESQGDYDAASWSYIRERQVEKICNAPWHARTFYGMDELGETHDKKMSVFNPRLWVFFLRHGTKWLTDWFVELLCGYGESVGRVVGWIAFVLFIGGPVLFSSDTLLFWSNNAATTFYSLEPYQRFWYSYLQKFLYVLDVFTTASFSELWPANTLARLLSGGIALTGIFLTGLLAFVVGNRIRHS